MDQKERDAQRALGNMEEFYVRITVPIKVTVQISQVVEAVSEEDAVEKMKVIHDILPDRELLQEALSKVQKNYGGKAEFDTTIERKYTASSINKQVDMCVDDCCESSG